VAPRITALVADSRGRVRVDLDGAAWRVLPGAAVVGARLSVGTELDRLRARTLRRELRRVEALTVATTALSRRDRSTAELEARLERRGVAPHDRADALEALERAGYVDDARFAASRAAVLAARGYGDEAIRRDLEPHRLAAAEIDAAVVALPIEADRARSIVERRGCTPGTVRRLAAKGFAPESIEAAIGDLEAFASAES
jgi:SOS response regulatory protein OraA/RecX